jgi:ribonuclease J
MGEVGKNCNVVEYNREMLLVDAGVKFPEEEMHGIDLVIPDFSYVVSHAHKLKAIVLTHGHEDHIGAIPYLLPQLEMTVPIYGSDLTLGLLEAKLKEHRVSAYADLRPARPGDRVNIGKFQVEFFDVNHSVPGSYGLAITTPVGTLVHSGDFKLGSPGLDIAGDVIDKLQDLGDAGVLVLMSDCVRVEQPGRTPPETVVADALEKIFASATGRIIITTFASNVARWRQAIEISARHGRVVATLGRSLSDSIEVAAQLGYITLPEDVLVPIEQVKTISPERVTLLVTGSQGEPTSVLTRMAMDDYRPARILEGDTVVIAASPVPGNEETVSRTIDNLFRRGARVIYEAIATNIHVSGHASRDELKDVIEILRPQFAVPVHGEFRHMVLYRDLAIEAGLDSDNVILAEQGDVMEFAPNFGAKVGQVQTGSVLVDGVTVGEVTQVVLRDRKRLAEDGIVIASVAIDSETGQLVGGPDLLSRGFVAPGDGVVMEKARLALARSLKRRSRGQAEYGYLMGKISDVLGAHFFQMTHRRPMILPVITEI